MIISKKELLDRIIEEQKKRAETLYRTINAKLEGEYKFGGGGVVIDFVEPLRGKTLDDVREAADAAGWEVVVEQAPSGVGTRLKFV